jgi:hypothetical protein
VRFFDQNAVRPRKNPLARIYEQDGQEVDDDEEEEEEEAEEEGEEEEEEMARHHGGKRVQRDTGRDIQALRGFGKEEEESETEKARRALSHARENCLGPGDFLPSTEEGDYSDSPPDPGAQGEQGDMTRGDASGSGGTHSQKHSIY